MKKIHSITFLLLFFASTTLRAQIDVSKLSEIFDRTVPVIMANNKVPGAFIALVKDDQVVYEQYFGYSDLKNKIPVDGQTGFNIGSISKVFTAWGIMKLVEQGKIGLDSPASQYLTRWQFPQSNYNSDHITIRSLLSHTAGLSVHGYYGWPKAEKLPTLVESLSGKPRKYTKVELIATPQTKFQYSGGGYSVLQLIIEEVTGDSFMHYMDTAVVLPIGMHNSSFNIDESIRSQSSLEYNKRGRQIPFELFTEQAAAGFHATPDDLIKFIQYNFSTLNGPQDEPTVISSTTLKEMLTVVPASEKTVPYGLGYRQVKTSNSWWHGGANAGWWALIGINPKHHFGLIVLTNSISGQKIERFAFDEWKKQLTDPKKSP